MKINEKNLLETVILAIIYSHNMMKETIVFSGCGGGMDIFGCLPLFYQMKDKFNILICSLSFTNVITLNQLNQQYPNQVTKVCDDCFLISEGNYADEIEYFPEYLLANQIHHPVYAIANYDRVKDIRRFYDQIFQPYENIKSVYLVDGGCDVLLKGTETEIATFVEDMTHLKALVNIPKIKNFYVCAIGLNVDCGHGVIESELLTRLNELEQSHILIKKEIFNRNDPKIQFYMEIFKKCRPQHSLVHCFVCSALEGCVGLVIPELAQSRINHNEGVYVSDLTKTFVICDGRKLASTIVYLDQITDEMTSDEIDELIPRIRVSKI